MATSGTEKILGGTRAVRYPDPKIKGTANAYGLYQWSAFDAVLVTGLNAGGFLKPLAGLGTGASVDVVVFTTDIPVVSRALITDNATTLQYSTVCPNVLTTTAVVSASGGSSDATIPEFGQVLSGYAGVDSDVPVTGFPLQFTVSLPGAAEDQSTIFLNVLANGAVINGVIGPIFGPSLTAPMPIILESSEYTQAIKDNNNILQLNSTTPRYQVVGLFRAVEG